MIVNLSDLADILGVSLPTVRARLRKGMPAKETGSHGVEWAFDTADVITWHIAQEKAALREELTPDTNEMAADSVADLKRRKLLAETLTAELDQERKEIELAEKKGLLVLIDDANAAIVDAVTTLRQRLLTVPRRVTPLILGETDDRIVKSYIEKEITDALDDLSRAYSEDGPSETSEETPP